MRQTNPYPQQRIFAKLVLPGVQAADEPPSLLNQVKYGQDEGEDEKLLYEK